jgi:hypothetical protein
MVGTSGSNGERLSTSTTSARSWPEAHVWQGRGDRAEHELDLVGEQRAIAVGRSAVGHVHQVNVGQLRKHFGVDVIRRPRSRRSVVELTRPGLRVGGQLAQGFHGQLGVDDDHRGCVAEIDDRREVAQRIVRELAERVRSDDVGRGGREQQRVTVGGGARR